ncbi:MAG: hypothetical protein VXZ82_01950 [Planctomycetota bacterium]|nr:hypothetical protein [Planctomycetota bacterium]
MNQATLDGTDVEEFLYEALQTVENDVPAMLASETSFYDLP